MKITALQSYPVFVNESIESESFYFPDIKGYFKKDSKLDDFTFPINEYIYNKLSFFYKYQLWENENGIASIGKQKTVYSILKNENALIYSDSPFFCNDYIILDNQKLYVVSATSLFNHQKNIYEIKAAFQNTPLFYDSKKTLDNDFHKKIISNYDILISAIDDMKLELNTYLESLKTVNGLKPPIPSSLSFTKAKNDIKEAKKELGDLEI